MSFKSDFGGVFSNPAAHLFNRVKSLTRGAYKAIFSIDNMGLSGTLSPGAAITNTRTSESMVLDHEGLYIPTAPGEISLKGARRERNIATSLTTHTITVEAGRQYQVSCKGDAASTVVASNAATGTLTNNGTDRHAFDTALTASTTSLALTITGTLTELQVEDITGRINTAPSESILSTEDYGYGVNGVIYYDITNGNTVKDTIVTEAPGYRICFDLLATSSSISI